MKVKLFPVLPSIAIGLTSSLGFTTSVHSMDALPKSVAAPENNKITQSKIELGKKLFFDTRLSKDGTVSCNSCHNVMSAGADFSRTSVGINGQRGGRNSPTVFNAAFMSVQFWDGRAASLEDQAKGPITNPIEMGMENHDAVVKRLKAIPGYVSEFEKVFGKGDSLNIDNIAKAIATYERTLVTPNSNYDKYVSGNKRALNAQEIRGMKTMQEVGCTSCHSGPNFAGPSLPVGTGFYQKFPMFPGSEYDKKYRLTDDLGRYEVTKNESDKHLFRVPTLRNVALTAPYFHNGSVDTLDEAVRVMAKTQLNRTLTEDQVSDIVAFLNSLTGSIPKQTAPVLPPTPGKNVVLSTSSQ